MMMMMMTIIIIIIITIIIIISKGVERFSTGNMKVLHWT